MEIKRTRFYDVAEGSDLEVAIENAGNEVLFSAKLIEDEVTVISWTHAELWNNTIAAVLEGTATKRFELTAIFSGADSFDLDAFIVEDGLVVKEKNLPGLTDSVALKTLITCYIAEDVA